MPKAKVKLDLHGQTVVQKIASTRAYIKAMFGNPTFVAPAPTLSSVGTATTKLETLPVLPRPPRSVRAVAISGIVTVIFARFYPPETDNRA